MSIKTAIVLAGGQGTRMKSNNPKVLCELLFKPMINWVIDACKNAGINNICAVTGYKSEMVKAEIDDNIDIAIQENRLGTGHAVMMTKDFLTKNIDGDVIVLCGDAPFMDSDTINKAYDIHKQQGNAATVITARLVNPMGYGRIVRNDEGIERIVEQKDASTKELDINEVNSGAYWFNVHNLLDVLFSLSNENTQGEYYLTDTIELLLNKGYKVNAYTSTNPDVILGANSRKDLLNMNNIAKQRIIDKHMENGVEFVSLDGIIITSEVKIGKGTVILPGTILRGDTSIGEGCTIGPNSLVENSKIADRTKFNASQCYNSIIESDVSIGPFCHIRPNSHILDGAHLGDFVEIKNSTIGEKTHVSHLTYVGDSDVGERVNFGCGVVTVNYNGKSKSRCTIGDDAFIGCNTNLVAPVTVGNKGYTAAGSTITDNVPDESLAIARARQVNKEGYNKKLRG